MCSSWHAIHQNLMLISSTLGFQRSFETLRRRHELLSRYHDPAGVLDALRKSAASSDDKNRLLKILVAAAQQDNGPADCALTLMLLALWPGLDSVRRRATWRRLGTPEDLASAILGRATEAIRCLDQRRVERVAATILMNMERDLLRERVREAGREAVHLDIDVEGFAEAATETTPAILGRDLRRLLGPDADLVLHVALTGCSQNEAASIFALKPEAARKRHQRACARLRRSLQDLV